MCIAINKLIKYFFSYEQNGDTPRDNGVTAEDVESNTGGTCSNANNVILRAYDQCEGDVLQTNLENAYSPENRRAINIQRNSDETIPKTFAYGEQESDHHGDRDEDNLQKNSYSEDNLTGMGLYSDRRTTDLDGGDKKNSNNWPGCRQPIKWNETTFTQRNREERTDFSEL